MIRGKRLWLLSTGLTAACALAGVWLAGGLNGSPRALAAGGDLTIRTVAFTPGQIAIRVANAESSEETIAVVTVDDAIVPFRCTGSERLGRRSSTTVDVPFDWVGGDPYRIGVTSSNGRETSADIAAPQ